jgi:hypothetical protein
MTKKQQEEIDLLKELIALDSTTSEDRETFQKTLSKYQSEEPKVEKKTMPKKAKATRKPKAKPKASINPKVSPKYKFPTGSVVWDKTNKIYGVVLNNFGNELNGERGDLRLDSDGVQPIFIYDKEFNQTNNYNLVPYRSLEDKGNGSLKGLKESAKSIIELSKLNKGINDKEMVDYYTETYSDLLSGKFDSPTSKQATALPSDVEEMKKAIKERTGKTEAECEDIISQYRILRNKSKVNRAKRIAKLKSNDELIAGTNVITPVAQIEKDAEIVKVKIEKQVEQIENKAEREVVKTDKTKDEIKVAVEKKVVKELAKLSDDMLLKSTTFVKNIQTELKKVDKTEAKNFLLGLRNEIDALLSKFGDGGSTIETYNITENESASSVNPTMFARGGGVKANNNDVRVKALIKNLDNTPYSIGLAILRERLLTYTQNDLKIMEKNPNAFGNFFISDGMYKDYFDRVIEELKFDYEDGGSVDDGDFARGGGITKTKTGAIKLYYHQTSGGAEYLSSSKVKGTKDEGSMDSEYIVRIDGAKDFGGELITKVLPYAMGGGVSGLSVENLEKRLSIVQVDVKKVLNNAPNELLDYFVEGYENIGTLLSNIEIASDLTDNESDSYYEDGGSVDDGDFATGGGVEDIDYNEILEVLKEKLEDLIQELPMDYENADNFKGEEVEKNSRDGFIAYTNGGYEVTWFEYISQFSGSGKSLPTSQLDDEMQRQVDYNYESAKERFIEDEEYAQIVEELGEDNINYSSLQEAGYEIEAEQLSEWEMDYDGDDTILCEIGAYYYDTENYRGIEGKNTIRLYGLVNLESPYHRRGNLDDSYDIDITFDSISELKEKIDAGLKEIINWFDGKYYKDSNAEMKITRMADGGEVGEFANGGGVTTNEGIINAFLNDNTEMKVGNITTHYSTLGNVMLLRNYGTLIAKRNGFKVSISNKKYSKTTSAIQNLIFKLANMNGNEVEYIDEDKFADGGLIGNQKRIDLNENGKIDAEDFKLLRSTRNGAWRKEHKYVNSTSRNKKGKLDKTEVRYAKKNNPSRTGYKGKTNYAKGGMIKPRLKKGDDVLIIGRRWFDKVNGNTYHTAELQVNGNFVAKSGMQYGYGDNYVETGKELLLQNYKLPIGFNEKSPLYQLKDKKITFRSFAYDGLKRDLAKGGGIDDVPQNIKERLEYLRGEIRNESISYEELMELQSLAQYIEPNDVELLEPAGVPEFEDDVERNEMGDEYVSSCNVCGNDMNSSEMSDMDNVCKSCSYAKGGKVGEFKNIMENNIITEKEINLIKMRMNNNRVDESTQEVIDYIWDNSPELTPDQNKKGIDYLRNVWKSPTGKERTNNPFGYREQEILDTFQYFELRGFYDAGNRYIKFYVPLYNCVGADSSFEYAFYNGKVNILG